MNLHNNFGHAPSWASLCGEKEFIWFGLRGVFFDLSIVKCICLGTHLVEVIELPLVRQAKLYSHVVLINCFAPTHEAWSCGVCPFHYF
jgi:membrane-anchored protein YejM (alkaline phosphatase superfamily)